MSDFPKDSLLARDLEQYSALTKRKPVIAMEMKFPKDYPMNPPFVRIIRPRFRFLTGERKEKKRTTLLTELTELL